MCFWMCTVTCLLQLVDAYLETVDLFAGHITRVAYFNGHHGFSLLFGVLALIPAC